MALDLGAETRTRTVKRTVTFQGPFTLSALQGSQPAGVYQVENDEEQLPTISTPAYRRVATWLRLPAPAGSRKLDRLVNVDASELETALAADAAGEMPAPAPFRGKLTASSGGNIRGRRRSPAFTSADWLVRNALEMRWIGYAVVAMVVLGLLMSFDLPRQRG